MVVGNGPFVDQDEASTPRHPVASPSSKLTAFHFPPIDIISRVISDASPSLANGGFFFPLLFFSFLLVASAGRHVGHFTGTCELHDMFV
ncbi:hypothetical protein LX36DRAFT_94601 [Colletotrichum falcatum]|nr:hypothetical protein LX36DRAFT_94601 [Colletotrichum falcatum]